MYSDIDIYGADDVRRFCGRYNVSRGNLYNMWDRGDGPPAKRIGGKLYIGRAEGKAWFEALPAAKPVTTAEPESAAA